MAMASACIAQSSPICIPNFQSTGARSLASRSRRLLPTSVLISGSSALADTASPVGSARATVVLLPCWWWSLAPRRAGTAAAAVRQAASASASVAVVISGRCHEHDSTCGHAPARPDDPDQLPSRPPQGLDGRPGQAEELRSRRHLQRQVCADQGSAPLGGGSALPPGSAMVLCRPGCRKAGDRPSHHGAPRAEQAGSRRSGS